MCNKQVDILANLYFIKHWKTANVEHIIKIYVDYKRQNSLNCLWIGNMKCFVSVNSRKYLVNNVFIKQPVLRSTIKKFCLMQLH